MSPTAAALLGFAAWTLFLLIALGVYRSVISSADKKPANSFSPTGDDLGGLGRRLTRAHANCYENLPAAGAIMLYAIATDQTAITDGYAGFFIAARIAQSLVHIASTSNPAVMVRFGFFIIQLLIQFAWLLALFGLTQ